MKLFEKNVNNKINQFDTKLKELNSDCNDNIDILKDYIIKEHRQRKIKRIFKSWVLLHKYNMNVKKKLVNIIGKTNHYVNQRIAFAYWSNKTKTLIKSEKDIKFKEKEEKLN